MLNKIQKKIVLESFVSSLYFDYNVFINEDKVVKIIDTKHIIVLLILEIIKNKKNLISNLINTIEKTILNDKLYSISTEEKLIILLKKLNIKEFNFEVSNSLTLTLALLKEYNDLNNIDIKNSTLEELLIILIYITDKELIESITLDSKFKELSIFLNNRSDYINEIVNNTKEIKNKEEIVKYIVMEFSKYISNNNQLINNIENNKILNEYVIKKNINNINKSLYYFREKELYDISYKLLQKNKCNIIVNGSPNVGKRSIIECLPIFIKKNIPGLKDFKFITIDLNKFLDDDFPTGFYFKKNENSYENIVLNTIFDYLTNIQENTIVIFDIGDININENRKFWQIFDRINHLFINNIFLQMILINDFIDNCDYVLNTNSYSVTTISHPNKNELLSILNINKVQFEEFYNIELNDNNIKYLVDLIYDKYTTIIEINDTLDFILAKHSAHSKSKKISNKNILKYYELNNPLSIHNVELEKLKTSLKENVFGQDEVIDSLINRFEICKAGLNEKNKPIGSFLFSGNSGTGKTEMARQLSYFLNTKLLRYDMSEFQESHTISKFLGSPAGYVGYEEGSPLIQDLIKNPNSILLLDEIEKAHPSVIKLFLQVLEEGTIKGSDGKQINLNNNIILFTTNAGSKLYSDKKSGFIINTDNNKSYDNIKDDFPIEFINRLDEVIYFNNLSKNNLKNIIDKEIKRIIRLLNKDIKTIISDDTYNYLLNIGFDENLGARQIKRVVDKEIKILIAKTINTFNKKSFKSINIDYINNKFEINLN